MSDRFSGTSVQLSEVSGGKSWMLFLSDYHPNKANVTGIGTKHSIKTSLAALLSPLE